MSSLVSQVFYLSNSIYLIYLVVEYYFTVNNTNSSIASFELFIQNVWFVTLADHLLSHLSPKQHLHFFNFLKQSIQIFSSFRLPQPNTIHQISSASLTHFQLIGQFHLIKQLLLSKDFGNCFRNNNWFAKVFICCC